MESYVHLVRESLKRKQKVASKQKVDFCPQNVSNSGEECSSKSNKIKNRKSTPYKQKSPGRVSESFSISFEDEETGSLGPSHSENDLTASSNDFSTCWKGPRNKATKNEPLNFDDSDDSVGESKVQFTQKKREKKERKTKKRQKIIDDEPKNEDWMEEVNDYDFSLLFASYDSTPNEQQVTTINRIIPSEVSNENSVNYDEIAEDLSQMEVEERAEHIEATVNDENEANENNLNESFDEENIEENYECEPQVRSKVITVYKRAEYYNIGSNKIVILRADSTIYFHGVMTVKVLHGQLEVMGYVLTTGSQQIKVYSPRGTALLYLKNPCVLDSVNERNLSDLVPNFDKNVTVTQSCCVIECKRLEESKILFLEKHISQHIFPQGESYFPRVVFEPTGDYNLLNIDSKWNKLLDAIHGNSKTFIVGGKGVGKSTFLRYAINKLLCRFNRIRIIDLDPGQAEFTPPGVISVVEINEPVFGPNYTHLMKTKQSFASSIDPGRNPREYLTQVHNLTEFCDKLDPLPTLVNYMGFVTGLGVDILAASVNMINPNNLIQINSKARSRNLKGIFIPQMVYQNSRFSCGKFSELNYNVSLCESMVDNGRAWSLEPRQSREMCVIAYFGEIMNKNCLTIVDTRVPMFEVNLSQIKIMNANYERVSPKAANANLVALCSRNCVCYGYGVVRGVDLVNDKLVLLSPLNLETLEKVTVLVVGHVNMPPSLLMTMEGATGPIPYISRGELLGFNKFTKRSYLPANKR